MNKRFLSSVKRASKHVTGLTTSYEAGLTPNIYKTIKTDKSTRLPTQNSQRSIATKDIDEDEELFDNNEFDSIFIYPEQEKRIQSILEFARKGKINPANAFDIPVTVLDPGTTESGGLRFWKFASELLGASICIYDKRVENIFLAANQVFNSFVRSKNNPQAENETHQTAHEKSKRKKCELMRSQIEAMIDSSQFTLSEIGKMNLEDVQKLNIKNYMTQLQSSPLFQRQLQMFDSNSLNGLLLNTFELGKELEIDFIGKNILCKIQHEKMEMKQQLEDEGKINEIFERQIKKLSLILNNQAIYNQISEYLQKNSMKDQSIHHLDFSKEYKNSNFNFNIKSDDKTNLSSQLSDDTTSVDKFSFHFVSQFDSINEFQSQNHSQKSVISRFAASQQCHRQFLILQDEELTVIAPRQLQFKGLKLHKKYLKQARSKLDKVARKRTFQGLFPFNSQQLLLENRSDIIKPCLENDEARSLILPQKDKFLLGKSMDPFFQIHRNRRKAEKGSIKVINDQINELFPKTVEKQPTFVEGNEVTMAEQNEPQNNLNSFSFNIQDQLSTEGLQNMKTFGLKSIRQIKSALIDRLQNEHALRLSQLELSISPASAFIIFLHLVNELGLEISSKDQETDLAIIAKKM